MDTVEIFWLAFIQGLTEFLPISSSAHLILPSQVLGWEDQGLAFDVAVHVGSLSAIVFYLRNDLRQLITAWFRSLTTRVHTAESKLAWYLGLATVPVGFAGLLLNDIVENQLRSIAVIAMATIGFGLLLGMADRTANHKKGMDELGFKAAMWIGLAQAVALIPGTSRSGITMTAALALGFDRVTSARFSFLLSIPVIILSGGFKAWQLVESPQVEWGALLMGVVISGVTAFACIYLFLKWINRIGMMPFVWYRMVLGLVLTGLIWQ